MNQILKYSLGIGSVLMLSACSTVYPLGSVAKRTSNSNTLRQDVSVDTSSREQIRQVAWAGYSVKFECEKNCGYSPEERKAIAKEIAETSFVAFNRELRKAFGVQHPVLDLDATLKSPAFSIEVKNDSFQSTVSRWLDRLGLSRCPDVLVSARNLKIIDPTELGWSGGESLAALGKQLGVDAVLVGFIRVTPNSSADASFKNLVITGPKLWLFSSSSGVPVAIAGLRPAWRLERRFPQTSQYDWNGFNEVASGFSARVVQALAE